MDHPNVLRLHDYYIDDQRICLITDLMDISLIDYLNEHFDKLTLDAKLSLFSKIADGVHHCHEQNVMHRDIKLENILLKINAEGSITDIRLADFGFACNIDDSQCYVSFCGTIPYMAPEQLLIDCKHDEKVDIWCLGHILFALLTG